MLYKPYATLSQPLWALVLAAGAGRRLAGITGGLPKQFWRRPGGMSLLEETVERIRPLVPVSRTVVVVDRGQAEFVPPRAGQTLGRLLYQPSDRGTAAGVLFALTPVLAADPDAIVIVTPSDHGVGDRRQFRRALLEAAGAVTRRQANVVLFGVTPTSWNGDYGWIRPGEPLDACSGRLHRIEEFVEKPSADQATRLFAGDGLWSTMVLVARARALARLFEEHVPRVAQVFRDYLRVPQAARDEFLASRYHELPVRDFSRDVLTPARGLCVLGWPSTIDWSDLGTPERLEQWTAARRRPRIPEAPGLGSQLVLGSAS